MSGFERVIRMVNQDLQIDKQLIHVFNLLYFSINRSQIKDLVTTTQFSLLFVALN